MCDAVCSTTTLLLPKSVGLGSPNSRFSRNGASQSISACFGSNQAEANREKSPNSLKIGRNSIPVASGEYEYDLVGKLKFKDKGKEERIDLETARDEKRENEKSNKENGIIDIGDEMKVDVPSSDALVSSGVDFIELKDEEDLVRTDEEGYDDGVGGSKLEELEKRNVGPMNGRRGRQLMKRSNMLAKQVISIQSALSLGFVSQLWVDTVSVRPNLLSGELERFFLEDVSQVGDVVLIQDESVMENDFNMVGLETLVGYNVVTAGQRSIGKVRGYTFNINSGAVESLELDSFGVSIIPSILVSTYALLVEDVLEVVSDTVVVHEAAASRIQRLTKGFWGSQKLGKSIDESGDYSDQETQPVQFDRGGNRQRTFNSRKFSPKTNVSVDDWELPMDYL